MNAAGRPSICGEIGGKCKNARNGKLQEIEISLIISISKRVAYTLNYSRVRNTLFSSAENSWRKFRKIDKTVVNVIKKVSHMHIKDIIGKCWMVNKRRVEYYSEKLEQRQKENSNCVTQKKRVDLSFCISFCNISPSNFDVIFYYSRCYFLNSCIVSLWRDREKRAASFFFSLPGSIHYFSIRHDLR